MVLSRRDLTHHLAHWKDPLAFNPDRFPGDEPAPEVHPWVSGACRRCVASACTQAEVSSLPHRLRWLIIVNLFIVYRECPERPFADMRLFVVLVSILATFDITEKVDANGKEVVLDVRYSGGSIRYVEIHLMSRSDVETTRAVTRCLLSSQ